MLWHDDAPPGAGYNLLKLARNCYHRLCPHAPVDLPIEKSTTMQAYIQGAMVHGCHLNRERDIWHELHNGFNKEIDAYKKFLNELTLQSLNEDEVLKRIITFLGDKDRL